MTIAFGIERRFGSFCLDFIRGGFNQAGPLWFVWVLLVFDVLAAIAHGISQRSGLARDVRPNPVLDRPVLFAVAPFALSVDVSRRAGKGPFRIQISRAFLYLVYFIAGVTMGSRGIERGAFRKEGPLAKYWWIWGLLALGEELADLNPFPGADRCGARPDTRQGIPSTMILGILLVIHSWTRSGPWTREGL